MRLRRPFFNHNGHKGFFTKDTRTYSSFFLLRDTEGFASQTAVYFYYLLQANNVFETHLPRPHRRCVSVPLKRLVPQMLFPRKGLCALCEKTFVSIVVKKPCGRRPHLPAYRPHKRIIGLFKPNRGR